MAPEVTKLAMHWPDIRWRDYEEALDEARRQRRPILLSLAAAWCSVDADPLAHVSGVPGFADQRSLADFTRQFVLARVDVERRPDVRHRYEPVDLPAVLLLDPDGGVLLGGAGTRQQAGSPSEPVGPDRPGPSHASPPAPPADLRATLAAVEAMLLLEFDEVHGGFGVAPKRPDGLALTYAVDRYQASGSQRWHEVFSLSLDGVTRGLFDASSGGFYRSAQWRDWQMASTAKLLGVNAEAIRAYYRAYEATQRTGYLDVANRSLQFVLGALHGPAFYGSVSSDGRRDRTIFLPPNEEMVATLLVAARVTGEARYAEHARGVQQFLVEHLFDPDRGFAHYYEAQEPDGAGGPAGGPRLRGLLVDNAAALAALVLASADEPRPAYLSAAGRAADLIVDGILRVRKPSCLSFEEAAMAAGGLLALDRLTGAARYRRAALQVAGTLAARLAGQTPDALARFGYLLQGLLATEADTTAGALGAGAAEHGPAR